MIKKCTCGGMPTIKKKVSYTGGGRYKGKTRHESWKAHCCNCSQQVLEYPETEAEAIKLWNEEVLEAEARRDAPDKLIYNLEYLEYSYDSKGAERRDRALARILRILTER